MLLNSFIKVFGSFLSLILCSQMNQNRDDYVNLQRESSIDNNPKNMYLFYTYRPHSKNTGLIFNVRGMDPILKQSSSENLSVQFGTILADSTPGKINTQANF